MCWPTARADAIMVGRAAQGRPLDISRDCAHFLATGEHLAPSAGGRVARLCCWNICKITTAHGEGTGVRSARKHIAWYLRALPGEEFRKHINTIEDCAVQWQAVADYLDALAHRWSGSRPPRPLLKSSELDEPAEMAA